MLPAFNLGQLPFEDCFALVRFSGGLGFGTRGHGVDLESFGLSTGGFPQAEFSTGGYSQAEFSTARPNLTMTFSTGLSTDRGFPQGYPQISDPARIARRGAQGLSGPQGGRYPQAPPPWSTGWGYPVDNFWG